MKLGGADGTSITLEIEDYQFPEATDPNKKHSWHMITGQASRGGASWSFRYPALTCDESSTLAACNHSGGGDGFPGVADDRAA